MRQPIGVELIGARPPGQQLSEAASVRAAAALADTRDPRQDPSLDGASPRRPSLLGIAVAHPPRWLRRSATPSAGRAGSSRSSPWPTSRHRTRRRACDRGRCGIRAGGEFRGSWSVWGDLAAPTLKLRSLAQGLSGQRFARTIPDEMCVGRCAWVFLRLGASHPLCVPWWKIRNCATLAKQAATPRRHFS